MSSPDKLTINTLHSSHLTLLPSQFRLFSFREFIWHFRSKFIWHYRSKHFVVFILGKFKLQHHLLMAYDVTGAAAGILLVVNSFNSHSTVMLQLLLSPFIARVTKSRLSNLPRVTDLLSREAGIWTGSSVWVWLLPLHLVDSGYVRPQEAERASQRHGRAGPRYPQQLHNRPSVHKNLFFCFLVRIPSSYTHSYFISSMAAFSVLCLIFRKLPIYGKAWLQFRIK